MGRPHLLPPVPHLPQTLPPKLLPQQLVFGKHPHHCPEAGFEDIRRTQVEGFAKAPYLNGLDSLVEPLVEGRLVVGLMGGFGLLLWTGR